MDPAVGDALDDGPVRDVQVGHHVDLQVLLQRLRLRDGPREAVLCGWVGGFWGGCVCTRVDNDYTRARERVRVLEIYIQHTNDGAYFPPAQVLPYPSSSSRGTPPFCAASSSTTRSTITSSGTSAPVVDVWGVEFIYKCRHALVTPEYWILIDPTRPDHTTPWATHP